MNDNDRDLIIDLLSGSLDPDEAAAAEARIAASPELSAEMEAQRFALTELATQPKPRLTSDERTELRAELAAALSLERAAAPAASPRRGARWWAPVAGLATVAAVFLGFVVVSGSLGGSDSADEAAVAAAPTTTAAAGEATAEQGTDATLSAPTAEGGATAPDDGSGLEDEAAPLETPEAAERFTVASTMTVPEFPEGLPPAADLYALLEESEFSLSTFADSLTALGAEGVTTLPTESANLCREAAGPDYDTFHVVAAATPEEEPQSASYLFHSPDGASQVVNLDVESCAVLDSAGGADS